MRLQYVPQQELARIRGLAGPPELRTALFASACRLNALYMIARAGSGHPGTTLSCLDVVSWLFLNVLRREAAGAGAHDSFFSSKGHDAPAFYAALIGVGALDFAKLHTLRRLGGLPGHPDVSIAGVEANTGSLGMGVSKAKGMVFANRLRGRSGNVYVLTGDGELQEGQIWESLPTAAHAGLGEITVIVDHNKIQSDTWVRSVNDLGDLEAKFRAFGWHADRCDGHDMSALRAAFARLDAVVDRPKILIADTLKGKGATAMEPAQMDPKTQLYRFHSGAPAERDYASAVDELRGSADVLLARLGAPSLMMEAQPSAQSPPASASVQRLVPAYSRALVRAAEQRPDLVALDADLVLDTGLIPFRERFPDRFVECGIAEQDMVSQAGGMALRGLLPVVHSFACFLSTRPNEQIYNNASERTKIMYVGSLAGLLPAGPGHSHQSVRDISILAAVPDLVLLEPCSETEVEMAVDYCVNGATTSSYLRLVSIPAEVPYQLPSGYRLTPGRGVALREGRDGVVITSGPVMLSQAYKAAEALSRRGVEITVMNLPWLNRVDSSWLEDLARLYPWIITVDNHYVSGGQGQMILAHLAESPVRPLPRTRRIGVTRLPLCGGNTEVLRAHRLDAESLAEEIESAMTAGRQ